MVGTSCGARHAVLFLSGAITLALELLASRILTPFFGVSLYIWTGILSITLVALALGYWWGGWLAQRAVQAGAGAGRGRLSFLFALMPGVAALSLVAACLAYPKLFLPIAEWNLVLGSFVASGILLVIPLVCASSMNPLLVAIGATHGSGSGSKGDVGADSGAGRVFFVSTIGSVVGVLLTTFFLVPRWTNFTSVLVLAVVAGGLTLISGLCERDLKPRRRWLLVLCGTVGLLLAGVLLVTGARYLGKDRPIRSQGMTWRILEEVPSFYGNIKIVNREITANPEWPSASPTFTSYLNNGTVQGQSISSGQPGMFYVYGVESLARGAVPEARRILVLGLATGALPMRLQAAAKAAGKGLHIEAVDLEPACERLAVEYFGYDPGAAETYTEDARTFLRAQVAAADDPYDLIVFDLYRGDVSVPEYMLSVEALREMARCLSREGVVLFNLTGSFENGVGPSRWSVLKTIRSVLPNTLLYHRLDAGASHLLVLASRRRLEHRVAPLREVPSPFVEALSDLLEAPRPLDLEALARARILIDNDNAFPFLSAGEALERRRGMLRAVPVPLLLN